MEKFHDFIVDVLLWPQFLRFFNGLEKVESILLTNTISQFDSYISNAQGVVKAICTWIMAVFVALEFYNIVLKEEFDLERLYFLFIKVGIMRLIIYCAPDFLELLVLTGNWWCSKLSDSALDISVFSTTMYDMLSDSIPKEASGFWGVIFGIIQQIGCILLYIPNMIVWLVGYFMMIVLAYARNIELVILTALSPIPLCFVPWEGSKDITKRFIFSYSAVVLTGFVMLLVVGLWIELLMAEQMDIWMVTALDVLLIVLLAKAGGWAKEVLGQG
ncbi:MAG: hypothetical protein J6J86_08640 [Lachnospiraceae bacterium]|nr:hypothetical protein [Lachnospiraceae bacterium]